MERSFLITSGMLEIPCRIYTPDYGATRRVALGVHGFCGSKDDAIQSSIAEEMALFNTATVRFDLPAHGESPMTDEQFTVENCVGVLLAAATRAKKEFLLIEEFCIFATGFGAYLTVLALEELTEILGNVRIVLQTPDFRMADTMLAMKGMTNEEYRQAGHMVYGFDRKMDIPYSFLEELRGNMVFNSYALPMLLIHGEADEYLPLEDVQHFRRINDRSRLVVIPGAGHRFLGEGEWDMVLDLTRDWFECEQVTLCDWS